MGYIQGIGDKANELAVQLAEQLGTSPEQVIEQALTALEASLPKPQAEQTRMNYAEWVEEFHRTHPLPPRTGLLADKAFYDSLNDE
jgi:antitoxin VapB